MLTAVDSLCATETTQYGKSQNATNANATNGAIKLTTSNVYIVYRTNNMTIATFKGLTLADSKLGISE